MGYLFSFLLVFTALFSTPKGALQDAWSDWILRGCLQSHNTLDPSSFPSGWDRRL